MRSCYSVISLYLRGHHIHITTDVWSQLPLILFFQIEYENSGSEFSDEGPPGRSRPLRMKDYRVSGDRINLSEIFFSNEEYYSKLEELKKAHLRTMAELESMYRKKLQLKRSDPLDPTLEAGNRRVAFSHHYISGSKTCIALGLSVYWCVSFNQDVFSAVQGRQNAKQGSGADHDLTGLCYLACMKCYKKPWPITKLTVMP